MLIDYVYRTPVSCGPRKVYDFLPVTMVHPFTLSVSKFFSIFTFRSTISRRSCDIPETVHDLLSSSVSRNSSPPILHRWRNSSQTHLLKPPETLLSTLYITTVTTSTYELKRSVILISQMFKSGILEKFFLEQKMYQGKESIYCWEWIFCLIYLYDIYQITLQCENTFIYKVSNELDCRRLVSYSILF